MYLYIFRLSESDTYKYKIEYGFLYEYSWVKSFYALWLKCLIRGYIPVAICIGRCKYNIPLT